MRHAHPPGPTNWLAPLGLTFRHLLRMRGDRFKFLTELGQRYGDIAFFRMGTLPVYFLNHPQLIREVLVGKARSFHKLERVMRPLRRGLGHGLLTSEGPFWQRRRRLLQGMFRAERMAGYSEEVAACTRHMLRGWQEGQPVCIEHEMTLLTQSIMFRVLFGVDPPDDAEKLAAAVRCLSDIYYDEAAALVPLPDWLPLPQKHEKRHANQILHRTLHDLMIRHQTGEAPSDLLALLLGDAVAESDGRNGISSQVRDEAATMLVAGYHTTSVALSWMWYLLATHQDVQARVRAEADAAMESGANGEPELLRRLPYTEMVVKESLRLYPAAWQLFGREAVEEVKIGDYHLPRGSWVLISPAVTQRDSRFFPQPERFDPERFSADRITDIDPFAYIPFGAGPHVCIGNSLAMMEMTVIAAVMLHGNKISLALGQGRPKQDALVALRPCGDIRLVHRRLKREAIVPPAGSTVLGSLQQDSTGEPHTA